MYVKRSKTSIVVIVFYVDDLIIEGNCNKTIVQVKSNLGETIDMIDLGPLYCFLGIKVKQNKR